MGATPKNDQETDDSSAAIYRNLHNLDMALKESEQMDAVLNINDLPVELIVTIFGYLEKNELCRIASVCKKWNSILKYPVLLKQEKILISRCLPDPERADTTRKHVETLIPYVTHLKIDFDAKHHFLNFPEFSAKVRERCPELHALILRYATLMIPKYYHGILNLFKLLPINVRVLVLHHSFIYESYCVSDMPAHIFDISKIEILDLSKTNWSELFINEAMFMQMTSLRQLRLACCIAREDYLKNIQYIMTQLEVLDLEDTKTGSILFQIIRNYGFNLTKLYVCNTFLVDKDIIFIEDLTFFPRLEEICLRSCYVTYKAINSLIKSCPSLQRIYVGDVNSDDVYDYTLCESEKVRIIENESFCYHFQKVDYMHE